MKHLTAEEYNLLNKITSQTKTDCWFCLTTDTDGSDCVKDLETGEILTLQNAVDQLNEAIIPELINITTEEKLVYGQLMEKLQLPNPFDYEGGIKEEDYV